MTLCSWAWNLGSSTDDRTAPRLRPDPELAGPASAADRQAGAKPWDKTRSGRSGSRSGESDERSRTSRPVCTINLRFPRGRLVAPSPVPGSAASGVEEPSATRTTASPNATGRSRSPNCGEEIGGFRLVSELGRGAFGRVYLAEEARLGNRPVALKVTRPEGDEPRLLARLQHTHIVPIHSVHDDPVNPASG